MYMSWEVIDYIFLVVKGIMMPQGLKFQRDYSPAVDGHSSQTAFQITSRLRATSEQLVESTTYCLWVDNDFARQ